MAKARVHNEYFRQVFLNNRKSCSNCKVKLQGKALYSWGEYHNVRWRTVLHFCESCYDESVYQPLVSHTRQCGCDIALVYRGIDRPKFLHSEIKSDAMV